MGYLYDNLPFGRGIADCTAFYVYSMFIYFERADRFAADKPETILALVIKDVLPDVEDWQVSVIKNDHIVFRFHDPAQRLAAFTAVMAATPIELIVERVTFTQTGSTVLPSGQVFPAPAPPPPPFPDLGPIIGDLERRVNELETEEAHEFFTWLPPVRSYADLPSMDVLDGSVALTLDTGLTWQYDGNAWVPFEGSGGSVSSGVIVRPFTPGTLIVRETVFQKPDGTVGPTSAVNEDHMPCIGIIKAVDSPAPGFVEIQQWGDLDGFSGLVAGSIYICSKNLGQLIDEADIGNVDYPGVGELGTVVQGVGIAASASLLNIRLEQQRVN